MNPSRWIVVSISTVLVLSIITGCATNPATQESEFTIMSEMEEIRAGERYYPLMTQLNNGELHDPTLQEYIGQLGNRLASVSDRPNLPYHFNVVNSSSPNAYALPGGYISLTRGLLLKLENEDQLAGVLAHEIGHVAARHAARRQTRGFFANLLSVPNIIDVRIAGISPTRIVNRLGQVGTRAILASYSRSDEYQADSLGMTYMYRAGYKPRGVIGLQKMLLKLRENRPNLIQQFFRSHPLTEDRIDRTRQEIKKLRNDTRPVHSETISKFDSVVEETWKPRKPAYEKLNDGLKQLRQNNPDSAVGDFQEASELYEGDPLIHSYLGRAKDSLKKHEEARENYDNALKRDTDVFFVQFHSGLNHFHLNNYRPSVKNLRIAKQLLPGIPVIDFFMGRNHEELDQKEKASEFYLNYLNRVNEGRRAAYCRKRLREWDKI